MARVSFLRGDYQRRVADSADLILKNRYFEQNPSLSDDGAALIARPGLRYWTTVGTGPIRGLHSAPGAFNGDLFVASGDSLYRVTNGGGITFLTDGLFEPDTGIVRMAITQSIGVTPEHLFIADGRNLWLYIGPSATAAGTLTAVSTGPSNGNVVRIGDVYYQFTDSSVDTGTPAGTSGAPWLVALGANTAAALTNLATAIIGNGTAGTDYSTNLVHNSDIGSVSKTTTSITVSAASAGVQGNDIITTETGANISWGAATLTGGVGGEVTQITTPDDIGIFDVATVASYVICLPVQEGEFIGRFYWIEPGEITIDSLNFATAESHPDAVLGVRPFGDQFWLPGEDTTEVWYPSGDATAPMKRLEGVVFDRGTWEGTAVAIKDTLIIVDADGGVFAIQGGSPQRISNPGIEEEIRKAIQLQNLNS